MTNVHPLIQSILEACGAPKPVSAKNPIRHCGFEIYPNQDWVNQYDRWIYTHTDFEGEEDNRYGFGATAEECRDEIDERFL